MKLLRLEGSGTLYSGLFRGVEDRVLGPILTCGGACIQASSEEWRSLYSDLFSRVEERVFRPLLRIGDACIRAPLRIGKTCTKTLLKEEERQFLISFKGGLPSMETKMVSYFTFKHQCLSHNTRKFFLTPFIISGTKTTGKKETAASRISNYLMILGEILSEG